jgi:hypothetical protein
MIRVNIFGVGQRPKLIELLRCLAPKLSDSDAESLQDALPIAQAQTAIGWPRIEEVDEDDDSGPFESDSLRMQAYTLARIAQGKEEALRPIGSTTLLLTVAQRFSRSSQGV